MPRSTRSCEGCDGSGIRPDSNMDSPHSGIPVPAGFTCVERCDLCDKYANDLEAATAYGVGAHERKGPYGYDVICVIPEDKKKPFSSGRICTPTYDPKTEKWDHSTQDFIQLDHETTNLRLLIGSDNSDAPNIFIERQPDRWVFVFHPDDSDPIFAINVFDSGRYTLEGPLAGSTPIELHPTDTRSLLS